MHVAGDALSVASAIRAAINVKSSPYSLPVVVAHQALLAEGNAKASKEHEGVRKIDHEPFELPSHEEAEGVHDAHAFRSLVLQARRGGSIQGSLQGMSPAAVAIPARHRTRRHFDTGLIVAMVVAAAAELGASPLHVIDGVGDARKSPPRLARALADRVIPCAVAALRIAPLLVVVLLLDSIIFRHCWRRDSSASEQGGEA
mmetsp:Transcript_109126/g.314327  ORF Transcript_109126/g.314327 Transcript_109126/m.314327 type:complete len:201 (-) Transcript_109126:115-717(-)